jgi:uncharacterized SAM-binding protein YcdF (DUF218 family)
MRAPWHSLRERLRRFISHRPLLTGVVLGVALVLAARTVINQTTLVDWLIDPLQVPDTAGGGDAIVTLAAGVTASCAPNQHGLQRVLVAAKLFHEGRAPMVIFSGGRTDVRSGCSAAEGMRDLAVRLGVPRERIRLEESSTSTWENALRSDAVLRALGVSRIVLVTDRAHLRRAEACFRRFGYEVERAGVPVYMGHFDNVEVLTLGLREYAAALYYRVRGYTSASPAAPALVASLAAMPSHEARPGNSRKGGDPVRQQGPVVILGASYAKGWTPESGNGLTFVNKGVAGEQSFEMLARFDPDVAGSGARAVVIWGFVNDIFRTPRPEVGQALARVRESYLAMLDRSTALGITPILMSEVTMGPRSGLVERFKVILGDLLARQAYMDYVNRHVLDTNAWLRELAARRKILFLEAEAQLSDGSGRRQRRYAADDGSHLPAAAYAALDAYAAPLVRARLGAPAE